MTNTLDTNVLFQALYSRSGASHVVFRMVRDGHVKLALSVPVFEEYQAVLNRPQSLELLGRTRDEIDTILRFIAFAATPVVVHFLWRPNLDDEDDNMFVELAVASGSEFLITQNTKDFLRGAELKQESFQIVTPFQFLTEWRMNHGE